MGPKAAPAGASLFARFAYPPNSLGLCGPDDPEALLEQAADGGEGHVLRGLARGFEGAWPYLELIADANGIDDPLDARVVEAYWIGNGLLEGVSRASLRALVHGRFLPGLDAGRRQRGELDPGACPHHNFHVFSVYPWVALLKAGRSPEPLRVLEKCRVRWGRVQDLAGDEVSVRGQGLLWTGASLVLGSLRDETLPWRHDGRAFIAPPQPGEWVALHWDWVCHVLTSNQLSALRRQTAQQLEIVNRSVPRSGGAAVRT
ncbi:MAG TPA: DUF6390 family protein [Acidimicrobiales bacterium]|nr:DUF6390 family protein [Acidimicrobiales bacterium]